MDYTRTPRLLRAVLFVPSGLSPSQAFKASLPICPFYFYGLIISYLASMCQDHSSLVGQLFIAASPDDPRVPDPIDLFGDFQEPFG